MRRGAVGQVCVVAMLVCGLMVGGSRSTDAASAVRPCSSGLVALTFDDGPA